MRKYEHLHSRRANLLAPTSIKSANKNPSVDIEFFEGELKGTKLHFEKNLLYQLKTQASIGQVPEVKDKFSIGKDNRSDYAFPNSTMKQVQCIVEFDPAWGWQIKDETGHFDVSRTCVYLANKSQLDAGTPSMFVQLFDGMVLVAGEYDLRLKIRNTNPDYPPEDIFATDFERFMDETEDEVRKAITGI